MPNIIIFGEMGTGKNTVATMFSTKLEGETVGLGEKIRKEVDHLSSVSSVDKSRRELYQAYGQGMRKIFGEDLWNNLLLQSIEKELHSGKSHIIYDARQSNEYDFWTSRGFIPVAVVADRDIRMKRLGLRDGYDQSKTLNHETEVNAREITEKIRSLESAGRYAFTIVNNNTHEELKEQVQLVVDKIYSSDSVDSR